MADARQCDLTSACQAGSAGEDGGIATLSRAQQDGAGAALASEVSASTSAWRVLAAPNDAPREGNWTRSCALGCLDMYPCLYGEYPAASSTESLVVTLIQAASQL